MVHVRDFVLLVRVVVSLVVKDVKGDVRRHVQLLVEVVAVKGVLVRASLIVD